MLCYTYYTGATNCSKSCVVMAAGTANIANISLLSASSAKVVL